MTISLNKILTISAREYCEMVVTKLSDYSPVGVHIEKISHWGDPTEYFAEEVPDNAEAVVNYNVNRTLGQYEPADIGRSAKGIQFTASGTALIRKGKQK